MNLLPPVGFGGVMFNVVDNQKFAQAMQLLRESLFDKGATMYASDNVICWNRNLSFLREDFFRDILNDPANDAVEKSLIWRRYILLYFAEIASKIEGDFVELGCFKGDMPLHVIKKLDFAKLNKKYFLYDLFGWKEGDEHTHFTELDNVNMYDEVKAKFTDYPFVTVTKGSVPETLDEAFPEGKIAFAHIDMNHPTPEAGALKRVLPKLSKGGIVLFDDYGWWGYSQQKMALDPIIAEHGHKILELPTGQAILINS